MMVYRLERGPMGEQERAIYSLSHRTFCEYVRGLGDWKSCHCEAIRSTLGLDEEDQEREDR